MGGRVLLIGGVAAARIVLRARLTAACYEVTSAAEGAAGRRHARGAPPDAIVVDADLPDMALPDLLRSLRATPALAHAPILVTCADPPALACEAIAAGADDVLPRSAEILLTARLRNLMRHRATLADLSDSAAPVQALGLAEAPAPFASSGRIALVPAEGPGRLEAMRRLRRDLSGLMADALTIVSPATALQGTDDDEGGEGADIFLIDAGSLPGEAERALRLMSELRSRGAGRHAAFCLMRSPASAAEDAVAFDLGAADLVDATVGPHELALRLARVLARKRAADRLRASVRDGLRLAVTDALTGLGNRRFAFGRLAAMAEAASRTGAPLAAMVIDLDRFKRVNDQHGHAAGDAVLVEVARRLAANVRPGDLLARIGGEEFLVALPDTGLATARRIAERLRGAIEEQPVALPDGSMLPVTASIGLAVDDRPQPGLGAGVQGLLDRADRALFGAKAGGRNKVTVGRSAA